MPPAAEKVANWRQKLSEYNLTTILKMRTFDILLMVESDPTFEPTISTFHQTAKNNPESLFKSINREDLVQNLNTTPVTPDPQINSLLSSAMKEATAQFEETQIIQAELFAQLVKLNIISAILLDIKLHNKPSEETSLRHLYIVGTGFHDVALIEELAKINVKLTAIVEVSSNTDLESKSSDSEPRNPHRVPKTTELPILKESDPNITCGVDSTANLIGIIKSSRPTSPKKKLQFDLEPSDSYIFKYSQQNLAAYDPSEMDLIHQPSISNEPGLYIKSQSKTNERSRWKGLKNIERYKPKSQQSAKNQTYPHTVHVSKAHVSIVNQEKAERELLEDILQFTSETVSQVDPSRLNATILIPLSEKQSYGKELNRCEKTMFFPTLIQDRSLTNVHRVSRKAKLTEGTGLKNQSLNQDSSESEEEELAATPKLPKFESANLLPNPKVSTLRSQYQQTEETHCPNCKQMVQINPIISLCRCEAFRRLLTGQFNVSPEITRNFLELDKSTEYKINQLLESFQGETEKQFHPRPSKVSKRLINKTLKTALEEIDSYPSDNSSLSTAPPKMVHVCKSLIPKTLPTVQNKEAPHVSNELPPTYGTESSIYSDKLRRILTGKLELTTAVIRNILATESADPEIRQLIATVDLDPEIFESESSNSLLPDEEHEQSTLTLNASKASIKSIRRLSSNISFSMYDSNRSLNADSPNDTHLRALSNDQKRLSWSAVNRNVIPQLSHYFGSRESPSTDIAAPSKAQVVESSSKTNVIVLTQLDEFWKKILAEEQPRYLVNTAHMKIKHKPILFNLLQEQTLESFSDLKMITEMKNQHEAYLKQLKIFKVRKVPKVLSSEAFKVYNSLSDFIPPECFSVGLLLNFVVEEIAVRLASKRNKIEETESEFLPRVSTSNFGSRLDNKLKEFSKSLMKKDKAKLCNYLPNIVGKESVAVKMFHTMEYPFSTINEDNLIKYKLMVYPALVDTLRAINFDYLLKCQPVLLMQDCNVNTFDLYFGFQQLLYEWKKYPHLGLNDFALNLYAIEIDNMRCKNLKDSYPDKEGLRTLFPPRNYESNVVQTDLKRLPLITLEGIEAKKTVIGEINIPKVQYLTNPSLHECKNIHTYKWYEQLEPMPFLQNIALAQKRFACLDHKFSAYGDALLLRYHNDVDEFGINSRVWKESLPSAVGFRDFCKYVSHQEKLPKVGYDIGPALVKLTGTTTTFSSLDGCKITVENNGFVGQPHVLSINICSKDNYLVLHYRPGKLFGFHFKLADDTIISFEKSTKSHRTQIEVGEMAYRRKTRLNTKEPTYKTTYRELPDLSIMGLVRRSDMLNQDKVKRFLQAFDCLCTRKRDKVKKSKVVRRRRVDSVPSHEKLKKVNEVNEEKVLHEPCGFSRNVQKCQELQMPVFKVCSSALHKHSYLVKAKSYVKVPCGKLEIPLLSKHPKYNIQRTLRTVHLYALPTKKFWNSFCYNIRISLPTGLLIYSVPNFDNRSCNFKQKYLEKGPQCKAIAHEKSRTFLRNGYISIRRDDGTIRVLSIRGVITNPLPSLKVKHHIKYQLKRSKGVFPNARVVNFRFKLLRFVRKKMPHIMNTKDAKMASFVRKTRVRKPKPAMVSKKVTISDNSRRRIRIIEPHQNEENGLFYRDHFQEKVFKYKSKHSLTCLLNYEGKVVTEFKDRTRISSIPTTQEVVVAGSNMLEVWTMVDLIYTFEHPNYSTICYNDTTFEATILLPNATCLEVQANGQINLQVKNLQYFATNKRIGYKKCCPKCTQSIKGLFNVSPLYNGVTLKKPFELFQACDTYDKVFSVMSDGICYKNFVEKDKNDLNIYSCDHHLTQDHQELYIMNQNYSGVKLVDCKELRNIIENREDEKVNEISIIADTAGKKMNYDHLKFITLMQHYSSRFLTEYEIPDLVIMQQPAITKKDMYMSKCIQQMTWISPKTRELFKKLCLEQSPTTLSQVEDYLKSFPGNLQESEKEEIVELASGMALNANVEKWTRWHQMYDIDCTCDLHVEDEFSGPLKQTSLRRVTITESSCGDVSENYFHKDQSATTVKSATSVEDIGYEELDDVTQKRLSEITKLTKSIMNTIRSDRKKYLELFESSGEVQFKCDDKATTSKLSACEEKKLKRRLGLLAEKSSKASTPSIPCSQQGQFQAKPRTFSNHKL